MVAVQPAAEDLVGTGTKAGGDRRGVGRPAVRLERLAERAAREEPYGQGRQRGGVAIDELLGGTEPAPSVDAAAKNHPVIALKRFDRLR